MALRWKENFSCSHPEIDRQHRRLFEIGSKLSILEPICGSGDFTDELLEVVAELKAYSIHHFEYEEALMERAGFSELAVHRQQHAHFIDRVSQLEGECVGRVGPEQIERIIAFISEWITMHILKADMLYVPQVKSMVQTA